MPSNLIMMAASRLNKPPLWTPLDIGGSLTGWWNETSSVTNVSGTASQWNDISGNGRHFIQTGLSATRPSIIASGLNGKRILRFNGSSNRMFLNTETQFSAVTAAVVWVSSTSNGRILDQRGTGAAGDFRGWTFKNRLNPGTLVTVDDGLTSYRLVNNVSVAPTSNLSLFTYKANNATCWVNGTTAGTQVSQGTLITIATTKVVTLGIDTFVNSGQWFNGDIAEVVLVFDELTVEVRQKLEGYFAHSWGLTANLPGGHPYKTVPPTK